MVKKYMYKEIEYSEFRYHYGLLKIDELSLSKLIDLLSLKYKNYKFDRYGDFSIRTLISNVRDLKQHLIIEILADDYYMVSIELDGLFCYYKCTYYICDQLDGLYQIMDKNLNCEYV